MGKGSEVHANRSGDLKSSIQWDHTGAWSPEAVSPPRTDPSRGTLQRPGCSLLLGSASGNYMRSKNSLLQTHTNDAETNCKQFLVVCTLPEIRLWATGLEPPRNNEQKCPNTGLAKLGGVCSTLSTRLEVSR